MNEATLENLKQNLLNKKSAILNKTQEFHNEQAREKEVISDEAEIASNDLSNNLAIHLLERDRLTLYQIELALSKISNGTYGECESCGEMINSKRLEISPFTTLCIDCKEDQESLH